MGKFTPSGNRRAGAYQRLRRAGSNAIRNHPAFCYNSPPAMGKHHSLRPHSHRAHPVHLNGGRL